MFYVYAYLDPYKSGNYTINGIEVKFKPLYIGKGKGTRYLAHLKLKDVKNPIFENKIKHWQRNNVSEQIIIIKDNIIVEQEAFDLEIDIIKLFGRLDNGTGILLNLTDGGDGVCGRDPWNKGLTTGSFLTEDGRARLSAAHTGKILSAETKQKMSDYWKGKTYTEETKRKISESLKGNIPWNKGKTGVQESYWKGKKRSLETRQKMSAAQQGKVMSDEQKKKISETTTGVAKSEETKRRMSENKKEYWRKRREERDKKTKD